MIAVHELIDTVCERAGSSRPSLTLVRGSASDGGARRRPARC